jgi:hypothetical protein
MLVVDSKTGEIIESPFRTMYSGIKKTAEDCSDPFQKTYKELPPYAVDPESKKILNKKSVPVLVEDEPFNIDEYIQSFKDECDIYTILEKFALTGCTDQSLINKGVMSFGDISELPDNFNDLNEYFENANKKLNSFSKDVAAQILDDSVSVDTIQNGLSDKIAAEDSAAKKAEVKE